MRLDKFELRRLRLQALGERQNWRCAYCGIRLQFSPYDRSNDFYKDDRATLDHIIPRSLGGLDIARNLVVACNLCNSLRMAADALAFFASRAWEPKRQRQFERRAPYWMRRAGVTWREWREAA